MRRQSILFLALGLVLAALALALALQTSTVGDGVVHDTDRERLDHQATAPSHVLAELEAVVHATDAQREDAESRPAPPAPAAEGKVRVPFRVVARGSGRPLAGAEFHRAPDWRATIAVTDERGEASIEFAADLEGVALRVHCEGHGTTSIDLEPVPRTDVPIVVELAPYFAVIGRIVGRDDAPVAEADVVLGAVFGSRESGVELREMARTGSFGVDWDHARSDSNGAFRVEDVVPDLALMLRVRAPGKGACALDYPARAAEAELDLGTIRLENERTLAGRVVSVWKGESTETGDPVEGVRVSARSEGLPMMRVFEKNKVEPPVPDVVTDAEGRFEFAGLCPERYDVTVLDPALLQPAQVRLGERSKRPSGPTYSRQEVDLREVLSASVVITSERTSELRGRVLTPDYEPAAHVSLVATFSTHSMHARSDAQGRFVIEGLGRMPVRVTLHPSGATSTALQETVYTNVVSGGADVQFVLAAADWIEGRVLDARGGAVASAGVTARSMAGAELSTTYTETDGHFRIRIPRGEAVDLEACPSRKKDERTLTIDTASPYRAQAKSVRAGSGPIELVLAPRD